MWNPFRRRLGPGNFSANLQAIISLSRQEAIRLDNDFIHSVHFLLAVLADKSSSLYALLASLTPDVPALQKELENVFQGRRTKQRGVTVEGSLPLTRDFEKTLSNAFRIAAEQGAKQVEASHIALGMWRNPASFTADILRNLGLSVEKLQALAPPVR